MLARTGGDSILMDGPVRVKAFDVPLWIAQINSHLEEVVLLIQSIIISIRQCTGNSAVIG